MIDTTSTLGEVKTRMFGDGGKLVVHRVQDVEPCLEQNKREITEAPSWRPYASGKRDNAMRKVASIPLIVAEQWLKEGINVFSTEPEQRRRVAQKLNSNEYAHLRTYPGRVGYRT